MNGSFCAKDLVDLALPVLPGTVQGVTLRADTEQWPHYWAVVPGGGKQKRFRIHLLPEYVRQAIVDQKTEHAMLPAVSSSHLPALISAAAENLPETQCKKAYHKAALTKLYCQAIKQAPWGGREQAREAFMTAYNSGAAYPDLYQALGRLAWQTIEAWAAKIKRHGGDALCLADLRGSHKKGHRAVNEIQAKVLLAIVRQPKGKSLTKSGIIEKARKVFKHLGQDDLSAATYRRWLDEWIAVNFDEWTWWREGDQGLNDKCLFWVERDYDQISVGDILVADGHVLNFLVTNPWTGKACRMMLVLFFDMKSSYPAGWVIMPTENTAAISAALRLAILRLGKIPKVVYLDNGRAFKGQYFTGVDFAQTELPGLYERLGIRLIVAKAYHGQSKTIERFFREFRELEIMAPSFVGTSIDNKPPHMNRGEKLHRRVHEKITGGHIPTIEEAHAACGAWFDEYGLRPHGSSSHMAGLCPLEVFEAGRGPGVDRDMLRLLMMRREERSIHACRVKVSSQGDWYYHPSLYGRNHKVFLLHDLPPGDTVLVYDQRTGEFICEAGKPGKVHPAAAILGTEADVALLSEQLEFREGLRKQTIAGARAFAEEEVIPEARRQLAAAGFAIPDGGQAKEKAAVRQLPAPKLSEAEKEQVLAEVDKSSRLQREMDDEQIRAELENMTEFDRYDRLLEMEMQGEALAGEWRRFMRVYEQMPEYLRDSDYWESRRTALAIMYGSAAPKKEMAAG
jgi:putative transposase